MGWLAYKRDGTFLEEGHDYGRPVEAGQNNELCLIGQIDYGHSVAVNLNTGEVALDWSKIGLQNGTFELHDLKLIFYICEETNRVGEFKNLKQEYVPWFRCNQTKKDENGQEVACDSGHTDKTQPCEKGHERKPVLHEDGTPVTVRNDILTSLIWRPIWFTRHSMPGGVTKVVGAQTTLPKEMGGQNIKKIISLFEDGTVGID